MKLRRKLLSAGLALGATALTLTTSTFAWYTGNTNVTMTGVQGTSASTGNSTLLISSSNVQGTFGSSVNLATANTGLIPVQYTSAVSGAPTFNKIGSNGTVDQNVSITVGTNSTSDVLSFNLYFKANDTMNVNLRRLYVVNNNAESLPAQDLLTTVGTPITNGATSSTYTVDILRSLKVAWYSESVKSGSDTTTSASVAKQLDNLVDFATDSVASSTASWNAHTYYNTVTGNNITTTGSLSVTSAFTVGSGVETIGTTPAGTESGTYLHVVFYFFIDGWDLQCFDACRGQNFSISMEFTSNDADHNGSLLKGALS